MATSVVLAVSTTACAIVCFIAYVSAIFIPCTYVCFENSHLPIYLLLVLTSCNVASLYEENITGGFACILIACL